MIFMNIFVLGENTVMIAINEANQVTAAVYITQGQKPFTYNDITKYFKVGDTYQEYVKSQYDPMTFKKTALDAYAKKMEAYRYAKEKLLQEFPQYSTIEEFLQNEISSANQFDEKSILREKLNSYMSEFILNEQKETGNKNLVAEYERFYWMTAEQVGNLYGKNLNVLALKNQAIGEYEKLVEAQQEHQEILKKGSLQIHEKPAFSQEKYFTANTSNSIEIDTYITDPNQRHVGLARALVFEGVKKHIHEFFSNSSEKEIFLCSTLHRENLSSKYVSEFFGLKDNLFVKRRSGRDREVHITRVEQENAEQYVKEMEEKLAVLYGYHAEKCKVSDERKKEIIQEQLEYEKGEYRRLNRARHSSCNYTGNRKDIQSKADKIVKLKQQLKELIINKQGRNYKNDGKLR